MESPVEKKKRFSSADNCLISSATVSENQQQSSGSFTVIAFGEQQKKQMNKRTLKKIWICSDILMDILPFFDRPQLGLKLALLSPRFDALVDAHFDAKTTELTLWKSIQIQNYSFSASEPPQLCVSTAVSVNPDGFPLFIGCDLVKFPLPDRPLHSKIRFESLRIEYIDHSVIEFLRSNQQIFDKWGTNLSLFVWSNKADDSQPIWDVFAREIWPIFAPNIRHLGFPFADHLDILRRLVSPTILSDLINLSLIDSGRLLPDVQIADQFDGQPNAETASSAGQTLSKWLHTPRSDGQPNRLLCFGHDGPATVEWVNKFKKAFLCATTASACYEIRFNVHKSTQIMPFESVNERTQEKLTLVAVEHVVVDEEEQDDDDHDKNMTNWLLKRCPISEKAAAIKLENLADDLMMNTVQFQLYGDNNCIGPLSPPAADQSNVSGGRLLTPNAAGPSGRKLNELFEK